MVKKMMLWGTCFILGILVIYGVWVIVSMNRTATIATDYVAILNEKANAVPEDQRAWPLYRTVGIALQKDPSPDDIFFKKNLETPVWPDQEGWNYYIDWLKVHQDTIDTIHDAANYQTLGYVLHGKIAEVDKHVFPDYYASQQSEELDNGSVLSIIMPQYGLMRQIAFLLSIDAKTSANTKNVERCIADIEAIMTVGLHLREHSLLISDLVSLSIFSIGMATLSDILQRDPTLFSISELHRLAESLRALEGDLSVRFDGERISFLDILQRIYTDDGNGDGRIIPQEAAKLYEFVSATSSGLSKSLAPHIMAPLLDIFVASRKEMLDEYERRFACSEMDQGLRLHELYKEGRLWCQIQPSASMFDRYYFLDLVSPVLTRATLQGEYVRARRDGLLAALFAVQKYQEDGHWPTDLNDAGVVDAWSGEHLRIKIIDSNPLIYSVGGDQDDDGGNCKKKSMRAIPSSDGDWALWPNQE